MRIVIVIALVAVIIAIYAVGMRIVGDKAWFNALIAFINFYPLMLAVLGRADRLCKRKINWGIPIFAVIGTLGARDSKDALGTQVFISVVVFVSAVAFMTGALGCVRMLRDRSGKKWPFDPDRP